MARSSPRGGAPRGWRRRRWSIVALLLALSLVGHDFLMAADAHAAPPPAAACPATGAPAAAATHLGGAPDAPAQSETVCEAGWTSAPRPDLADRADSHRARPVAASAALSAPTPPIAAAPPTVAPGVRRALTQVFLI